MSNLLTGNIYLLQEDEASSLENTNSLKLFRKAIYAFTKQKNVNFSYSNGNGSLHNHLTIFEILQLESLPLALNSNRLVHSEDFIKTIENPFLKKIIQRICPLDRSIKNMTNEELKLASLSKALLSKDPFLFLDGPDNWLSATNINLVKNCLKFEAQNHQRIIILKTNNQNHWLDCINSFINAQKRSFNIQSNNLLDTTVSNINDGNNYVINIKKTA